MKWLASNIGGTLDLDQHADAIDLTVRPTLIVIANEVIEWTFRSASFDGRKVSLWVTCGRRPGKSFFDAGAALVGCGHVSGLLMRQVWPLALMLCADRVPIVNTHF